MPMIRTTFRVTRERVELIRAAANRQAVQRLRVRPRGRADTRGDGRDDNPHPMRALAAQPPAIDAQRSSILPASSWRYSRRRRRGGRGATREQAAPNQLPPVTREPVL